VWTTSVARRVQTPVDYAARAKSPCAKLLSFAIILLASLVGNSQPLQSLALTDSPHNLNRLSNPERPHHKNTKQCSYGGDEGSRTPVQTNLLYASLNTFIDFFVQNFVLFS